MDGAAEAVLGAAQRRAAALTTGDGPTLRELLHPDFVWTSHTGERFSRDTYLAANLSGPNGWHEQRLEDVRVAVVGDTGVLTCQVTDLVDRGDGPAVYRMPMTQVWVRSGAGWVCLGGHAGPRTDAP